MEWHSTRVHGSRAPQDARRRALEAAYPERSPHGAALRVELESKYRCHERYSFAIPRFDILKAIGDRSPHGILELGAGTGYWSHLLSLLPADVVAVDREVKGASRELWHPVIERDGREVVRDSAHERRTLFLCWPDEAWAPECLRLSKSDTLAYVGAKDCVGTGGDSLAAEIWNQWSPVWESPMPNWHGESTHAVIYERRSASGLPPRVLGFKRGSTAPNDADVGIGLGGRP